MHVRPALVIVLLASHELARLRLHSTIRIVRSGQLLGRRRGVLLYLILLVYDFHLFVFTIFLVRSRIWSLFLETCPWSFVSSSSTNYAGIALGLPLSLLRVWVLVLFDCTVSGAESCFAEESLRREACGHAPGAFLVPRHGYCGVLDSLLGVRLSVEGNMRGGGERDWLARLALEGER